jgi:hypothetical protein
MRRTTAFSAFIALGALIWLTVAPGQGEPRPRPGEGIDKVKPTGDAEKVEADADPIFALARRADFPGIDDPKVTLDDALKMLSKLYNVHYEINVRAFKYEMIIEPEKVEIAAVEPIPPAKNVRLDVLVKRILRRMPYARTPNATFLVRKDCIEITTTDFARIEVWGEDFDGPFLPLVHLRADKLPLTEALTQLADQGRLNIVYAGGADKAATPITVRLVNVPEDTAVRLVALQAGLSMIHRDNVLVVTTPEKATALMNEFRGETPDPDSKKRRGSGQAPTMPPEGM